MTLPNWITISRLGFLVLIGYLMGRTWPGAASLAMVLSVAAAVSDWLDGYIARRWDMGSNVGKILDAFVDKVMVIGLYVLLLYHGLLPLWCAWLVLATVARDLAITGIRMRAARVGVVLGADKWGKRKTIWQMTAACVFLAVPAVQVDLPHLIALSPAWLAGLKAFFWLNGFLYFLYSFALAVYSGVLYLFKYRPYWCGRES